MRFLQHAKVGGNYCEPQSDGKASCTVELNSRLSLSERTTSNMVPLSPYHDLRWNAVLVLPGDASTFPKGSNKEAAKVGKGAPVT